MKNRKAGSRLVYLGVIFCLLVSMIFSGCGSPEPAAPQPSAPGPSAPEAIPDEGPQYGGTLRIAKAEDALVLGNPSTMFRQACSVFAAPAIEKLVVFDSAGDLIPGLATGWDIDSATNTITDLERRCQVS